MAEKLKVELTDEEGNIYYLSTDASSVYCADGTTVETALNNKIAKADINATTVIFDETQSRSNINTGESFSTLFGKIKKWFTDLKSHVFSDLIQNASTSSTTQAPSAAVTKSLQDQVNTKQPNLGFTPVRQGTGIGQNGSIIHIGYSPSNGRLKATVDSTDFGNIVFDSQLNNYCYKTSAYRILSIQEVVISAGNLTPNSQTTGHAWFPAVSGAVAYYPFLKNQGWCSTTGASISGTTLEVSFVNTGPNAHTASAIYYVVAIGAV